MFKRELVSIIVPTHNRADMLGRALDSIVRQTYENWETIVIANDCHDHTAEVMERYIKDKRFTFINIPAAIGGAEARNIGLRRAKGEYLAFLDDDDEWLPEKVTSQLDSLLKFPDVAVVSTNHLSVCGRDHKVIELPEFVAKSDLLYNNDLGSFSFCLTKAEFVKGIEIDKKLLACQDWSFWLDILYQNNMKGYAVQKVLALYNNNPDNSKLSQHKVNKYGSYIYFLNKTWHLMNKGQRAHNLAKLYKQQNLLVKQNIIQKLRLSVRTLRMMHLSPTPVSIRETFKMVVLPLVNIDNREVKRNIHTFRLLI